MVRQTGRVIFVEALGAIIVFVVVIGCALAIRLSAGPVSLDFAKDNIEKSIANARDGREVELGEISLEWLSAERRAIVVATDFDVFDESGELAANAERVEILLDVSALVRGKFEPIGLVLDKGWINVRVEDGFWKIAGDPIGNGLPVDSEIEDDQTNWLNVADTALRDVLATVREDADGIALQAIQFGNFELIVNAEDDSEIARLQNAYGDLRRGAEGVEIVVGGTNIAAEDAPGRFTIGLSAPADYAHIEAEFGFLDWTLQSVLDWVPDYEGVVEGFATDATVAFRVSDTSGLEDLQFGITAEEGRVVSLAQPLEISSLSLGGNYTLEQDRISLEIGELVSSWISGPMNITIENALHGDGARQFSLSSKNLVLDLRKYFEDVWSIDAVEAEGKISWKEQYLTFDRFEFVHDEATISAAGDLGLVKDQSEGELPFETNLQIALSGNLDVADVLLFWPEGQGKGARGYIERNVKSASISRADVTLAIARDSIGEGHLSDDAIAMTFEGENLSVQPLPDIPVVTGASISGAITGNSVKIDFTGGALNEWQLTGGSVHYPQLVPAGADMIFTVHGKGPAQKLVQMISDSRLQLEARSGFNPKAVSGDAEIALELRRPALPDTPISAIRYSGEGQLNDGGLENVFAGLALSESVAQIEFDQTGLRVFGDGVLQSASLSYDWQFPFGVDAPPAEVSVSSVLNPDLLNHLGVPGRAYMTGNVPIDVQGTLSGTELQTATIDLDFQEARLDIAELGWVKSFGDAAIANVEYERSDDEDSSTRVNFSSADASLEAAISLAEDGKLIGADIDSAQLADRFDVSGTALRTSAGGLRFDVTGKLLDLSQLVPNFAQIGNAGSTSGEFGDVAVVADIQTLVLGREIDLSDAKFALAAGEDGLHTIDIQGKLQNGSAFTAAYDAGGLGDPAFIVTSGDAGFLPNLLFGNEILEGGELELTGTVGQDDLPTQVHVVIKDGRLINAPVITQILSLASLRGLSDTLSGDGILFSDIDVPLSIHNGRYDIVGAKASGPALGLTAKGWITPSDGGIDVDGVLVPSFGVNSALGGLPLIGDLFVNHDGEGVFSLRYGVEGTLERAQVSVNPLSAITPGVLRRIFEEPETADLPPLELSEPVRPDE